MLQSVALLGSLIAMPVASLVAACGESRVVPEAIGCTGAAERYCASSDAAVGACFAGLVAMPVASLVAACGGYLVVPLWVLAL